MYKPGKVKVDPLRGLFETTVDGKPIDCRVHDPTCGTREEVPLLEEGGIEAFIRREVLPYTSDAWVKEEATKIGYEVSFTRHFYKPQKLRTLDKIRADIIAIEKRPKGCWMISSRRKRRPCPSDVIRSRWIPFQRYSHKVRQLMTYKSSTCSGFRDDR